MSGKSGFKAAHFFELLFGSVVRLLLLNRKLDTRLLVWTFLTEEDGSDFKNSSPPTTSAGDGSIKTRSSSAYHQCRVTMGVTLPIPLQRQLRAIQRRLRATPLSLPLGRNKCYRDISDGTSGNTGTSPAGGGTSPGLINPAMRAVNTGISLNSANTALIVAFGRHQAKHPFLRGHPVHPEQSQSDRKILPLGAQNFLFIGTAGTGSFSALHSADDVGERVKEPKKKVRRMLQDEKQDYTPK
ncbi:hypothetical protein B0H14DRAFT_2603256 [Mycena olivaceomarginata]|nr:hypothetical protein B0H14DRAFT_2603256 [Mycena olivaceomarginata]